MKIKSFFLSILALMAIAVSCQKEEKDLGLPDLTVDQTSISFDGSGSDQVISFVATRAWEVSSDVEWLAFDPSKGEASEKPVTVKVSVLPNNDFDRDAIAKVSIGFTAVSVKVSQVGAKGSVEDLVLYSNDFDKEVAVQSGTSWPYLDASDVWKNEKGKGIATVSYKVAKVSARNNSNSNGSYSDYSGSGANNLFFGVDAYLAIEGISLNGHTSFDFEFGSEKYLNDDKTALFSEAEFPVYVSVDNKHWVSLEYKYNGTEPGRWNIAKGSFGVADGVSTVSILFKPTVASAYRLDDFKFAVSASEHEAVDFSKGIEIDIDGSVTPPGPGPDPLPDGSIYSYNFKTSGQGSFVIDNVTMPSELTYVWNYDDRYGMKASAYLNSTNYATESWLISPEIDLSAETSAWFSFSHAGNYFTDIKADVHALVSDNGGSTWNELQIATYPTNWTFASSGKTDISAYAGKKIKIAFKYTSSATKAGTWEIESMDISREGTAPGPGPEPEPGPDPEGNVVTISRLSDFTTWSSANDATYGTGFAADNGTVSIAYYKASSTTAPVTPDAQYGNIKVYKNAVLVVKMKNGKNITGIKMTCSGTSSNPYAYDMTVAGSSTKATASGSTITWTGNLAEFIATADGGQIRPESMEITYAK